MNLLALLILCVLIPVSTWAQSLAPTVNVPMKTTARFLVKFDERPGEWMFHCHILDHADGGLMGTVLVGPVAPSTHVHKKKQ